jgi:hypothetical protein
MIKPIDNRLNFHECNDSLEHVYSHDRDYCSKRRGWLHGTRQQKSVENVDASDNIHGREIFKPKETATRAVLEHEFENGKSEREESLLDSVEFPGDENHDGVQKHHHQQAHGQEHELLQVLLHCSVATNRRLPHCPHQAAQKWVDCRCDQLDSDWCWKADEKVKCKEENWRGGSGKRDGSDGWPSPEWQPRRCVLELKNYARRDDSESEKHSQPVRDGLLVNSPGW